MMMMMTCHLLLPIYSINFVLIFELFNLKNNNNKKNIGTCIIIITITIIIIIKYLYLFF